MKKKYIKPQSLVISIITENLMQTASGGFKMDYKDDIDVDEQY